MSNKVKTNQKKGKFNKYFDEENDTTYEVINYLVAVFGIVLCLALTLYLPDGYIGDNALKKIDAYKWIGGIGILIIGALALYYILKKFPRSEWRFYNTDYLAIGFVLMSVISSIVGGNFSECILGYNGWYMGIISQVSFILLYFLFSRFSRYYKEIVGAILCVAAIAFLIAVFQRIMIDPFDFYYLGTEYELDSQQKNDFLSTMGQVSWYSGFVATIFPIGMGVFWAADKKGTRIGAGIFSFIAFMTLVSQNSDSAYMAILGCFMVFFLFSTSDKKRMLRFWEALSLFVLSTRATWILLQIHPNDELILDSLSNFMINNKLMIFITIFVLAVTAWVYVFYLSDDAKYPVKIWKGLSYCALALVVIGIIASVIILIMSAKGTTPEWLAEKTAGIGYLNWNDDWGNHRGMSWTVNLWMIRDMGIVKNIFGIGPDNYPYLAYELFGSQLEEMFDATLANAHNEWANTLISFGILGFVCYYGMFVSAIRNFAKKQNERPILVGIIATIVAYMAHNFFCYQTVCCTPFLFIIIGIGTYIYRSEVKYDDYEFIITKLKNKFASKKSE